MNNQTTPECGSPAGRAEILPLLHEIARILTEFEDLQEATAILLTILRDHLGVERGMFTLYHRRTGTIFIHESIGLTAEEKAPGMYRPGEGLTGRVVETGQAIVIPRLRQYALTGGSGGDSGDAPDHCFLCFPIRRGKKVLGTISAEKTFHSQERLQRDAELLELIATILTPAIELHLLENEDRASRQPEGLRTRDDRQGVPPSAAGEDGLLGNSRPMREVFDMIGKIAGTQISVLVLGESGVGKELVASAVHRNSTCAEGPFIKCNCAALPAHVLESELFGHERGAFTGADSPRKGRFEEADGGTIFLDEIGELPLAAQAKLLRVLQEKTFERVGGNTPIRADIRIIAATNRDLPQMVAAGTFREDLYYRLNAFPITLPPLRQRGDDLILLADHFLRRAAHETGKQIRRISPPALQLLMNYPWPGNVRELENILQRAVILCEGEVIRAEDLPATLAAKKPAVLSTEVGKEGLESKIESLECECLVEALKRTGGNMTAAADHLGMTRRMLGLRLKKYQLEYKTFRHSGKLCHANKRPPAPLP